MIETATARRLAERQLSSALPRRWSHVAAVASRAESIAPAFVRVDGEALVQAAWLHDPSTDPKP